MFGKIMNRYYYGKSGKGDFTKEDLPETRWQLFWEMLRVRFTSLFKLNLLYMVAWLPVMIVIGRALTYLMNGMTGLTEMQLQLEAGEITQELFDQNSAGIWEALRGLFGQTLVLLVPAIAVTGPFTAGAAYITRNWARDEHAFVLSDYWDTVKANWKQGLLTSLITSVVPLLLYVCTTFYGDLARTSVLYVVPQVLCVMLGLVWLCGLLYMYPQMVTYEMSFPTLVRNSFIMAVGRLPQTVGIKLLSTVPTLLAALLMLVTPYAVIVMLVYGLYYVLLGFALSRFVGASYANGVFDRFINTRIEGAQVGRGLYVESDEDSEDEPQADPTDDNE